MRLARPTSALVFRRLPNALTGRTNEQGWPSPAKPAYFILHDRRSSKDYEGLESSSEAAIYIVMIRLMLRRLAALPRSGPVELA